MAGEEILRKIAEARLRQQGKDTDLRVQAQADQMLSGMVDRIMSAEDPAEQMVKLAQAVGEASKSEEPRDRALGMLATLGLARVQSTVIERLEADDG